MMGVFFFSLFLGGQTIIFHDLAEMAKCLEVITVDPQVRPTRARKLHPKP